MKTKTFINKVESLGFRVHDGHGYLEVVDVNNESVVDVLKMKRWVYDCEHDIFESLHEVKQTQLMEIVIEYVTTQVKDREEEKRYRLRLNAPIVENPFYLHYGSYSENFSIARLGNGDTFKTIFTESELAEMDITGFEPEEVEG